MSSLAALAVPAAVEAQSTNVLTTAEVPSGILTLEASASEQVAADIVHISLFYEAEQPEPAALTQMLNQRTDAALQASRGQDAVKVKTGSFSISPSTDRDGRISAWRGRSEIELESRDFAAASRLAGQLSATMQVGSVDFSLSPQARQAAEQALSKRAIASFQQQALSAAQAFGYKGFTVRSVNVGQDGTGNRMRVAYRALAAAPSMAKMDAVPLQAGTTTVTVTVNGAVQMTR